MEPLHLLGAVYDPDPGPSRCAVCGDSPYAFGRKAKDVFGPNFTDYDLLKGGDSEDVCQGCAKILGGKPGDTPMPLRLGHFVVVDGVMTRPSIGELCELVYNPPAGVQIVAWTAARKKHTSLRCGACDPDRLVIGTEDGPCVWDVEEGKALLDAVTALRAFASQDHILTGQYPPAVILALGEKFVTNEDVVSKYRPSLKLNIAVALARRPENTEKEELMPISEDYRRAGALVLEIGNASLERDRDPIAFWSTLFPRRLAAAANRPTLLSMVGTLTQAVKINPTHSSDIVGMVEGMTEEQAQETLRLCRETPLLVVAYSRIIKEEEKNV